MGLWSKVQASGLVLRFRTYCAGGGGVSVLGRGFQIDLFLPGFRMQGLRRAYIISSHHPSIVKTSLFGPRSQLLDR